jgi:hypothetical protein
VIRTPLRPYQQEAVAKALPHDGFLLIPEQRTGKCLISLTIVDNRKPDILIIVCPIAAIKVWDKQIDQHLKADWNCQVVIVNYEELMRRRKQWYAWAKKQKKLGKVMMIIGDELHKIKKRGAKQSKATRQLSKYCKYRLGLTGTPIAQGIHDAWALCDFANKKLFGSFDTRFHKRTGAILHLGFSDRFLVMGGFKDKKVVGEKNREEFEKIFHSISYRITLREARGKDRPLKMRHTRVWVDLDTKTREFYDTLEEELIIEVNKKKVSVPLIISLSMKLQQIAGGFILDHDKIPHRIGREKLRALKKVVKYFQFYGKKFVVVCRFIHEIMEIHRILGYFNISCKVVRGGEPFDGKFDTDAVILQVQSGIAVDMASASNLVFYSTDYSYLNYEQAKFRILDYDKPQASFYYLLARDTIDVQIYEAVRRKKNLAQLVLDRYRRRGRTHA